jgi:outer membrane receptor protein involved in Fe transport
LTEYLKSSFNLSSDRLSAFLQDTWRFGDSSRFSLNYGVRFQYWDVNKEPIVTPRAQLSIKPTLKKDIILTMSGGLYYQPPFYREMRAYDGTVNTNLRAQKSAHAVIGFNYAFKAWGRPFSFVTEAYYKYLWDVVSFDYDNTLIRYSGKNDAKGYAAGLDLRLNGELAEGAGCVDRVCGL